MTTELTLENIRTGAFPSDAHAVGFLLGEIERLSNIANGCPVCAELAANIKPANEPSEQPVATPGATPPGEDSVWQSAESSRPRGLLLQGASRDASSALAHSPDVRREIKGKGDVPDSQFAGILKAAESGDAVNTMDLINALWWRVGNQRREIARLSKRTFE